MGFTFKHRGDFAKIERFLKNYEVKKLVRILESYGQIGVQALSSATPVDTGVTASSWSYQVRVSRSSFSISFTNSQTTSTGVPIVILLQYGHGTGIGGYVHGRDFINPVIQPIFDKMADDIWKEVTK